jgi:monoamine oxidase
MRVVIIGGGISGLYAAHLLAQLPSPHTITILEASNRLGGRIKSYKKGQVAYEIGAGRFSTKHARLMALIAECRLSHLIRPLTKGHSYYINDTWIKDDHALLRYYGQRRSFSEMWSWIGDNYLTWSGIGRLSLPFLLRRELNDDAAKALLTNVGYQDIARTNSKLIIETLLDSYDIRGEHQFNVLEGGLEQIVRWLERDLRRRGVTIRLNAPVRDVKPVGKDIFVLVDNDIIEADAAFVGVTRNALEQLPYLERRMPDVMDYIMPLPLMRIYATFREPWFRKLNPVVTDLPIEYVIPINPDTGVIMISYVDYKNVEYMRRHIKKGDLKDVIMKQIRQMMGRDIEEPRGIEFYDWTEGIHGYRPGANLDDIQDNIEDLAKQSIYVTGEMVSKTAQGWIEGALETAQLAVQRFVEAQRGGGVVSLEDVKKNGWIALRGQVFDVSGFISQHPGGANIYKGIGKEHTAKWNKVHSNQIYDSHLATEAGRKKYGIKLIGRLA